MTKILLVFLALEILLVAWMIHPQAPQAGWEGMWISKEEAKRVARYHGPYYPYRITETEMVLIRDEKETVVRRKQDECR